MGQLAPRAVAFDLDGLLLNTEELYQEVGSELLRRRGVEFGPALMNAIMGRPGQVALQMMIDHHALGDTVDDLVRETAEIFPAILDARLSLMPGAAELLSVLEWAGIPKAIATSSGRRFTHDVLARLDLARRFDFVLTCEDVTHGKPDPEIYVKAANRHGVPPTEMLVLEDSQNGCLAAAASGAVVVAVPSGHSRSHDFTCVALVAESLADGRIRALLKIA